MKWCSCTCTIRLASVTRPVKQLKDFRRITLAPGETRTVEFTLTPDQLSFLDEHMQRIVEPGLFDLMVGTSSDQVQTSELEVKDEGEGGERKSAFCNQS